MRKVLLSDNKNDLQSFLEFWDDFRIIVMGIVQIFRDKYHIEPLLTIEKMLTALYQEIMNIVNPVNRRR